MTRTVRPWARVRSAAATTLLLVTCVVAVLAAVAIATDHVRVVNVLTGSMSPAIPVDTLVVATPVSASAAHVGQVIVFLPPADYTTPGALPVVHRIASVATVDGVVEIRTKGDANSAVDPWTLDAERTTLFTPAVTSPAAGRAAAALGTYGLPALGLLLVLGVTVALLRRVWAAPQPGSDLPGRHCRATAAPTS